jgi:hypothetical protein
MKEEKRDEIKQKEEKTELLAEYTFKDNLNSEAEKNKQACQHQHNWALHFETQ